jgi:hypothetical protein
VTGAADNELDRARILEMAAELPALASCASTALDRIKAGETRRRSALPFMIETFCWVASASIERLRILERAVEHFDRDPRVGWIDVRRALARADRREWTSRYSECTLALALELRGLRVAEFEPSGAPGKRVDLALETMAGRILAEVIAPTDADADYQSRDTQRVVEGLRRIDFGLRLEVRGYRQSSSRPAPGEADRIVAATRRAAGRLSAVDELPATLYDDGVTIDAVARLESGTEIVSDWQGPVAGDPERLAAMVLSERKHFANDEPGVILLDIANIPSVVDVDSCELADAAAIVARRSRAPAFLGAIRSPIDSASLASPRRRGLYADPAWVASEIGIAFRDAWCA